jgi:copper chaperone CopZ
LRFQDLIPVYNWQLLPGACFHAPAANGYAGFLHLQTRTGFNLFITQSNYFIMKKIFLIILVTLTGFIANAQLEKAEFQASGLTCSLCSNAINKALKTVPFIESINTDLNKNIFSIVFKKNTPVDLDAIRKKVEDAGFSIAKFWIIADLHNLKVDSDEHVPIDGLNFHFLNVRSQTLNGEKKLQLIDKNFVSAKEFKKNSAYTSMSCYQTGTMSACCKSEAATLTSSTRIYHVTI